ncbi:MAG: Arabinose operon regulatory protein [Verrucomicrobiae bacterium]|nr:Arabinose operon regulatory protein [Verrucomicrobiae bacterium]
MKEQLRLPAHCEGSLWLHCNHGRIFAMHHHVELEFNLVTHGTGLYLLANRKYEIRRGDLLWLFPAQEHVLIEQSPDFKMWIGVFKPQLVNRVAQDAPARTLREADPAGHFNRRLAPAGLRRLEALYEEIEASRAQTGLYNAGLAYALLTTWDEFVAAADVATGVDVHPAVEKAARLIRDVTTRLPVETLAQQAGLSPSRLSRLFKQQTGVTLLDFRNRQRLERFLELYGTGQRQKMLNVALEAGFGSYPQFHRVFKQVMGCSPAAYRREL